MVMFTQVADTVLELDLVGTGAGGDLALELTVHDTDHLALPSEILLGGGNTDIGHPLPTGGAATVLLAGDRADHGLVLVTIGVFYSGGAGPAVETHILRVKVLDVTPLVVAVIETDFDDMLADPLHGDPPRGLTGDTEIGRVLRILGVLFPECPAVIENQAGINLLVLGRPGTPVVTDRLIRVACCPLRMICTQSSGRPPVPSSVPTRGTAHLQSVSLSHWVHCEVYQNSDLLPCETGATCKIILSH